MRPRHNLSPVQRAELAPTGTADPTGVPASAEATLALAHAIRTPLTSLALGLGLLDDGSLGSLAAAQIDVVRALVGEVDRLTLLVDRALKTEHLGAYAGPVERVAVDLGELIRSAGLPIAAQCQEKGVRVRQALPAGVLVVVDPVKLGWVAATLMGNALRYAPKGSTIALALSESGGEAVLRITDQGPGLPPEAQGRVFDRSGGRSLFLAREIVEAHGGRIGVSSTPRRGCTFTVTLPSASRSRDVPGEDAT